MSRLHFDNPEEYSVPSYAIWDYNPMGFQKWLDPLRDFYSQLEESNDHEEVANYRDLFEEDVQQYVQHLLRMAPFNRPQVSLYNIICGTMCTTKEVNRLTEACKWADGQLPESFVALLNDVIRLGVHPPEALTVMKAYGNLIVALAESFLGNDRRRISTIFEAENIYNLFRAVTEPFVNKNHLAPWEKRQITDT